MYILMTELTKSINTSNHVHNIVRLFDGWADFPFTKGETMFDC